VLDEGKLLTQYRTCMDSIVSLNDFYRFLSTTLKKLRVLRNNRPEQSGNIVELFVRRLGVYFQKLDFHELVGIYNEFVKYKQGLPLKRQVNDFAVSRRLEEIKFGLENYSLVGNYEETKRQLTQLQEFDHNFKAYYLQALNEAEGGRPLDSTDSLHKYFDKSLCNLFQERTENSQMVNNVNHCILSLAYLNLRLGFVDESLKSISEGLRISQNNADEESINHCIIYLYQITSYLGMSREHILLTEHAITHCLNLNNTLLMLYSCLAYSELEKSHDCSAKQLDPQKARSLSWTDALHFAKKKIYSNF
jgi:tetratricopeptide (TPR) repeat protein